MASRTSEAVLLVLAVVLSAACKREARRFSEQAWSSSPARAVRVSGLQPGATTTADAPTLLGHPTAAMYQENAWAVSEGSRLFNQYNCVGCHANGGGGMGPALMDQKWRYGHEPQQIYLTILQGRPNGMPSFGGKLTEQQAWQLVAYVRSLSGLLRADVEPGRTEHMNAHSPPANVKQHRGSNPKNEEAPQIR